MVKQVIDTTPIGLRATETYATDASLLYASAGKNSVMQAGVIDFNDRDQITTATVLQKIVELSRLDYTLTQAATILPVNQITFSMAIATGVTAHRKVGELQEAEITKAVLTPMDFKLYKNVVHVVASDESQMQNESNLVVRYSLQRRAGALADAKNLDLADVMFSNAAPTSAASGSWFLDTTNPYEDINKARLAIKKAECGIADYMVANSSVWTAFFSHKTVKGYAYGSEFPSGSAFRVPGLPGVTGILDDHIDAPKVLFCNKANYTILAQGPTTAEQYREPKAGADGWIIRDWMQPKLLLPKAGYILTNVIPP
jgi:hypothetical protein